MARTWVASFRIDHQPENLGVNVVTQDRQPSRPLALAPSGRDLVPSTFRNDLSLKLSERKKDVQHQPAHGGRAVKLLGDRNEGDMVLFKDADDAGEVQQGPAEPVDFVSDQTINFAGFDVGQQAL